MESLIEGESIGTGTSAETLADEIGLTAENLRWRKEFVGFEREDADRLDAMSELVEDNIEALVDAFVEPIHANDRTTEVLGRSPRDGEQFREIVRVYLRTLTSGTYDREHFVHRCRIGRLHDRLDMPLHYFGGMFANLHVVLTDAIRDRTVAAATDGLDAEASEQVEAAIEDGFADVAAVVRGTNLDTQVINDTYLHSYSEEMREEVAASKRMRETVADTVEDLRTDAHTATESVNRLDSLSDEQSDRTAEVADEVSTLSATVEEVAATAEDVAETSDRAEELAHEGVDAAGEAVDTIRGADEARTEIAADVEALVDAVDEIEGIVEVIDDIAEQTNMLALNASIEAARAGSEGDGFAVVAEEVKTLANESKRQATRVEDVIEDVTDHIDDTAESLDVVEGGIEDGVDSVEASRELLETIADAVEEASNGVAEVAAAADDQAASSSEIASMVDNAADLSNEMADEAEQVARSVETQAQTADEIDRALEDLQTDDSGDRLDRTTGSDLGAVTDGGRGREPTDSADSGFRFSQRDADSGADDDLADLRAQLPDEIPPAIADSLDEATMREIVDGDAERPF